MAPKTATVGQAVFLAASEGDAHVVATWLDDSGGVDAHCTAFGGETLLIAAAAGEQEAMVRMLLQRGASVNLQAPSGCTALMAAAGKGHTTTVQALLNAKADASLRNISGKTALMWAEQGKRTATAQLLRQHARQMAEAEAAVMHAAATAPTPNLSGRRVRIFGLKPYP